jgi:hypothetical protein
MTGVLLAAASFLPAADAAAGFAWRQPRSSRLVRAAAAKNRTRDRRDAKAA